MTDRPRLRPRPAARALLATLLALAAVIGGLSACTGGDGSAPVVTAQAPETPVLQPGRPGEPNATVTGTAAAPVTTPSASPEDARFLQEMIVHHAQALVMVDAVLGDLSDAQVRSLASRIRAEQQPEIAAMGAYLTARGEDVPPEATNPNLTDHGSHSMPGMASESEVARLASATGPAADRLFLTLMIRHHQGAVTMVDEHARNASDELVEETASEISVTQRKQVMQMQEMLDRLT